MQTQSKFTYKDIADLLIEAKKSSEVTVSTHRFIYDNYYSIYITNCGDSMYCLNILHESSMWSSTGKELKSASEKIVIREFCKYFNIVEPIKLI